ncbi:spore coat protein U domain-containing protein [Novosphingobium sp. ZW T3_23]|uniref:spore coat protein U domain-containing protein n=1 Tax=Novosphingobium sp. ZW T3_23 TaxID=3378084 RepID=UPI0038520E7A
MKHGKLLVPVLALSSMLFPASSAQALCVLCSCSASTAGLAFGAYDPTSNTPRDANAVVQINCSGVAALLGTIDVSLSPGGSGSIANRRMAQGANVLSYNIYSDSNHTTIWGDGTGGTTGVTLPFNGLLAYSASVTAYGRISTHQYVRAGAYADAVTVTITY